MTKLEQAAKKFREAMRERDRERMAADALAAEAKVHETLATEAHKRMMEAEGEMVDSALEGNDGD